MQRARATITATGQIAGPFPRVLPPKPASFLHRLFARGHQQGKFWQILSIFEREKICWGFANFNGPIHEMVQQHVKCSPNWRLIQWSCARALWLSLLTRTRASGTTLDVYKNNFLCQPNSRAAGNCRARLAVGLMISRSSSRVCFGPVAMAPLDQIVARPN